MRGECCRGDVLEEGRVEGGRVDGRVCRRRDVLESGRVGGGPCWLNPVGLGLCWGGVGGGGGTGECFGANSAMGCRVLHPGLSCLAWIIELFSSLPRIGLRRVIQIFTQTCLELSIALARALAGACSSRPICNLARPHYRPYLFQLPPHWLPFSTPLALASIHARSHSPRLVE